MFKSKLQLVKKLHLYLGLSTGLVVFIIAITGCLWVFQEEITEAIEPTVRVEAQNLPFILAEDAKEKALSVFPDKHIHASIYGGPTDPINVVFYEAEPDFYQSVYLNPYTGEVLQIRDHRDSFFWFILKGHLYLWLPEKIGHQITRYSTLIFVFILITGIIAWWPKNKKGWYKKTRIRWNAKTPNQKRIYDLHSVFGFYASVLAFLIAYTGLIMAFGWVAFLTYKGLGGQKSPIFELPTNTTTTTAQVINIDRATKPINLLVPELRKQYPDYESIEIHYPEADSLSILVELSHKAGVYYDTDYRYFDQHSMQEIESPSLYGKTSEAGFAEKAIRMYYDIHVGSIGGIFGKIIAFMISLITASLPLTGFLFWWKRTFKMPKLKSNEITRVSAEQLN